MDDSVQKNIKKTAGVITTASLVSIFVYSFVVSLPGILINEVVETFSLEGTSEGLMGTLTSFGFLLSLFFVILFQGRAKKTTILIAALAAQAITLFLCGFSPVFFLFCISCLLVGFCGGFIDTNTNSTIVDVRKNESARYLGYLHGLFGVGSLLSPLLLIWALRHTSWRGIHYALAIASLLIMLLVYMLTRGHAGTGEQAMGREQLFTKADLLSYIKSKRNITLALAAFFSMFLIACVTMWIRRYMTLRYDADDLGALSITVFWVCVTANRFLLAQLIKKAPMKFFALGTLLSGVFILIGVFSGNPVVLCVMTGAFGFCSGHFVPVLVSESAVGFEGRTTFTTSIIMFVMSAGRMVAPVTIAFISSQISLTFGMMLPIAAAVLATVFGWFAIRKPT